MSQQINLYEARLRPSHELVTARNVVVALGGLLALLTVAAVGLNFWASTSAAKLRELQAQVSAAQEKSAALVKAIAEQKISTGLRSELDSTRSLVTSHQEILSYLDSGQLGNTSGFSAFMTGFARQTNQDLWLTGFVIAQGGKEIEIRGRTLEASRLPGYVQGLGAETVFQGRKFAALQMLAVEAGGLAEKKPDSAAASAVPAGQNSAPYTEFVLRSERVVDIQTPAGEKK